MAPRFMKPGEDFSFDPAFGFSGSAVGRHDPKAQPGPRNEEYGDGLRRGGQVKMARGGRVRQRYADGGQAQQGQNGTAGKTSVMAPASKDDWPDQGQAAIDQTVARGRMAMHPDQYPSEYSGPDGESRRQDDIRNYENLAGQKPPSFRTGGRVKRHFDEGGQVNTGVARPMFEQDRAPPIAVSNMPPMGNRPMPQSMGNPGVYGGGQQTQPMPVQQPVNGPYNGMMPGSAQRAFKKGGPVALAQGGMPMPPLQAASQRGMPQAPGRDPVISAPLSRVQQVAHGLLQTGAMAGARAAAARLAAPPPPMTTNPGIAAPTGAAPGGPMPMGAKKGGHITAAQRHALPASDFALPGERYPIDTPGRARSALSRAAANATPAEQTRIRSAVHRKYPSIGQK